MHHSVLWIYRVEPFSIYIKGERMRICVSVGTHWFFHHAIPLQFFNFALPGRV